ncbi:MAG TPA: cytochrome c [Terriglobales bacterium]|jgi:mono/diheme cytochrome c family protein|nr:cytochrome c [Terriglobales bacterium]
MEFRRCRIKRGGKLSSAATLLLGLGLAAGCRLDMHDQPRFKPLRMSDFYADMRSSRPLEPGTIARGELRADSYFYSGMVNGNPGDEMPFPATKEVLERGRERYNIYCAPCHSRLGDGNGMIVQRGYRRPPSYHIDRLRNAPLGHFFDVITNGFGAMPDYAEQIPARDRWAIIAYIRALQLSQQAPLSIVPPADRDRMLSQPPQPPATPGTGATTPGGAAGQGVQK